MSTKSLSSSAMLVSLNVSVWTARKLDKKVSNDVDISNSTKTKAGNYHKNLLAGDTELKQIGQLVGLIRTHHMTATSPWSDSGQRLLTTSQFFTYKQDMAKLERDYWQLVDEFLPKYNLKIAAAAFQLGSLFDRDEYPDVDGVASKFGFNVKYEPLPESGDFRVDIGNEAMADLQKQYEGMFAANIEKVNADAYDRLHRILTQLSYGLRTNPDGSKGKIYDTVIDNTKQLCGLLTHFNIKGDTELEAMRIKLEDSFTGVDAKDIKDCDYIRDTLKRDVDTMLDKWN
tara:strand:+ start:1243 stop:2100 length:858 start_codon:yes stop_codon:yes gene_type:complete